MTDSTTAVFDYDDGHTVTKTGVYVGNLVALRDTEPAALGAYIVYAQRQHPFSDLNRIRFGDFVLWGAAEPAKKVTATDVLWALSYRVRSPRRLNPGEIDDEIRRAIALIDSGNAGGPTT